MLLNSSLIDDFVQLKNVSPDFVWVREQPMITMVRAGSGGLISLDLNIKPYHYIIADHGLDKHLIYTTLKASGDDGVSLGESRYSTPSSENIPGLPGKTKIFRNSIRIQIPILTENSARKGIHYINGRINYQPCDARQCYFPRELEFQVKLRIV